MFTVHQDGTVSNIKLIPDASEEDKKAAEKAIKNASPFLSLPAGSPKTVEIEFTFDYNAFNGPVRDRTSARDIPTDIVPRIVGLFGQPPGEQNHRALPANLTKYLEGTLRKIKAAWHPPGGSENTVERITFNLNKDGTMTNLWLGKLTGDDLADRAILKAVEIASPYGPLPTGVGNAIALELKIYPDPWDSATNKPEFDLHLLPVEAPLTNAPSSITAEEGCPRLSKLWSKASLEAERNGLSLIVGLNAKGSIVHSEGLPHIAVYNSSKNLALDDFAKGCAKKSKQFNLSTFNNRAGNYWLKFDIKKRKVVLTVVPEIDWRSYLASLRQGIKRHWEPPISEIGALTILGFKVHSNGAISDITTIGGGAKPEYDKAAISALTNAAAFWNFPTDAPDEVDMQCAFDYVPSGEQGLVARAQPADKTQPPTQLSTPLLDKKQSSTEFTDAISEYAKSIDATEVASVHEKLADVFRVRDENDQAVEEYKAAARLRETANLEVKLGQAYQAKGNTESANASYARAMKIFPDLNSTTDYNEVSHMILGLCSGWEADIDRDPMVPENHMGYARQLQFEGNYSQARAELQQAINYSPGRRNPAAETLLQLLPASAARA